MCPPGPTSTDSTAEAASSPRSSSPSRAAILRRLTDAHCHPTDRRDYSLDEEGPAFASLELVRMVSLPCDARDSGARTILT